LTERRPWPGTGRPRRAAVSAFGMSGTNAHVILEQAPTDASEPADGPRPGDGTADALPFLLSGRSRDALRDQAARLAAHLAARPQDGLADISHSLATTRAMLDHRAVVIGGDRATVTAGLTALAAGENHAELTSGTTRDHGRTVFVFPGQGSQWDGMAVELLDTAPVFADRLRACARAVGAHTGWDVEDVLRRREGAPSLDRIEVVQPVLFSVMVSLADLWRSHGVEPDAVVGHSQGEIAAAVVSGALTLEDAARLIVLRSQLFADELVGRGAVASVGASRAEVEPRLLPYGDALSIAGLNSPRLVTVAGEPEALQELVSTLTAEGVRARIVPATVASHCSQVDRLRGRLSELLEFVRPRAGRIPLYSTVTGEVLDGSELTAEYWFENCRRPVSFEPVVRRLLADGFDVFVESSAHPVLALGVEETAEETDAEPAVVGTLRRDQGGLRRFRAALAELHVCGVGVDWAGTFAGTTPRRVELPTYAFQHRRYWVESVDRNTASSGTVETAFWETVEREDLESLAAALGVDTGPLGAVLPALASWRRDHRPDADLDSLRYKVVWQPVGDPPPAALGGTWLVAVPAAAQDAPLVRSIVHALADGGARPLAVVVEPGVDREGLTDLLREAAGGEPPAGVLSLLPLDDTADERHPALPRGLAATLLLLQALSGTGFERRVWSVTRGAVAAGAADRVEAPLQAQVWGLGEVAELEVPQLWAGVVDLPEAPADRDLARLTAMLAGTGHETRLAIRPQGLCARRLVRAPVGADGPATAERHYQGTVLITWGTHGPGAHLARRLAESGTGHLLLTESPEAPAGASEELVAELRSLGARVTVSATDPADRNALGHLLSGLPDDAPLAAVFHTAGLLEEEALGTLTAAGLESALRAKALGARHLHELTGDLDLSAFVLFSSVVTVLGGGIGLAGHAAANAYLDALAWHRRAQGLPATSLAWGVWDEQPADDGAAAAARTRRERLARRGLPPITPRRALAALRHAVEEDATTLVVADIDWDAYLRVLAAGRPVPQLGGIREVARALRNAGGTGADRAAAAATERLREATPAERYGLLLELVRAEIADLLGHDDPQAVDIHRDFLELGMDSVGAVALRNRLDTALQRKLPARVVMDRRTPDALARFLRDELGTSESGAEGSGRDAHPGSGDDLAAQYLRAAADGRAAALGGRIAEAANRRPSFEVPGPDDIPRSVIVATGDRLPSLICFPTVLATSGPQQFARFAASTGSDRDVSALTLPGFQEGTRLPATLDAVTVAAAEAVKRCAGGAPFALVGYSSGGLLAHAVTAHLEAEGVLPGALVLLDTFAPGSEVPTEIGPALMEGMAQRLAEFAPLSADRITAMDRYLHLLSGRRPADVKAPVLLVRPALPVPGTPAPPVGARRSTWQWRHEAVEVPGDHFSIIEEHAADTARAVLGWLDSTSPEVPPAATTATREKSA
ncbi:acyltransferase domain-containing protein, partial [Streptomyces sp. MUM 136J]|nr:acyltransferase domain-containing protein [Streptomyces sp. MUM 2J]MCH0572986.1 acyltransferase domain-containing protein [Streptomyces sp. MUM 136J]